jgi:hypothetical protein
MLTINKTRQHNLDILNDARQAKVAIKIRPTGDGASFDSAQVFMGVVRHIEYISNAAPPTSTGSRSPCGGIGYWRMITDYANDDSFDQEIFIRRVKDPLSVYLDPDINEFDGSDARFGFVFTDMPKDEFERKLPEVEGQAPQNTNLGGTSWVKEKTVRIAEYFRRVEVKDRLIAYADPEDDTGQQMKVVRESDLDPQLVKALVKLPTTKTPADQDAQGRVVQDHRGRGGRGARMARHLHPHRPVHRRRDGDRRRTGPQGPHARPEGPPADVQLQRLGLGRVRRAAVEDPLRGAGRRHRGLRDLLEQREHREPLGAALQPPGRRRRGDPRAQAPAAAHGRAGLHAGHDRRGRVDADGLRPVPGRYGRPSATSSGGAAINARQRQGDNATFHFLDHQSIAIRFTGKILIDLIPKVYDTERVLKIRDDRAPSSR